MNSVAEQEYRQMGMKGIHPHFVGMRYGDSFDSSGRLVDINGEPRETMYMADDGTPIFWPLVRPSDMVGSEEARGRRAEQLRESCFRRFTAYADATFGGGFDEGTDDSALRACTAYVNDFDSRSAGGYGLILYGPCGTGKTHLAACICNAVLNMGKRALMVNMPILTDEGAQAYGGWTPMLDRLCCNDLVVLDDLGREASGDHMTTKVYEAVNRLYSNRVPVIVTTNMDRDHIARPTAANRAVMDRLKERAQAVEVNGPNRRQRRAV